MLRFTTAGESHGPALVSVLEGMPAGLPLLAEHSGRLERRLRTANGEVEVHVVGFRSAAAFAAYRADPRRAAHAELLEASGAAVEVLEVEDLLPP